MPSATAHAVRWATIGCLATTLFVLPAAPPAVAAGTAGTTEVVVRSGQIELPGTVVTPPGGAPVGGWPALVIVHDAGPRQRDAYEPEARALAAAGIVTLIYDKRTAGYSLTNRSFPALAADAAAAASVLRSWPGVDPDRVGVLGRSEGGWVVPLAAARSPQINFVITVGASGLPPARTQAWSNLTHLDHAGVGPSLHRPLGLALTRLLVNAGMFGAAEYDPAPSLTEVDQPVLAIFGELDRSTAPGESVEAFRAALDRGGNQSYTIRVVPGADHRLRHSPDGFTGSEEFAPGYLELVTSWVTELADGPPSTSVDPVPEQSVTSAPLAPLAWYESVPAQLAVLLLMLAAFLAYPVVAVVRRLRGRRDPRSVRRWAATAAFLGPVTIAGGVLYLGYLTMTGTVAVGPVIAGRPVPWLLLQLLAVGVVGIGAVTAVRWWRGRGRAAPTVLAGTALFLPWALYWGLLTP
jgi:dienelactone hydrolase